eukprot:1001212-Rhodomonas_salina.1
MPGTEIGYAATSFLFALRDKATPEAAQGLGKVRAIRYASTHCASTAQRRSHTLCQYMLCQYCIDRHTLS